jgi:DNA-binding YbaB/EbfC family protein
MPMKGMGNLGNLMKQAQKMKAEMERLQAEAATKTVEGSAGGGMVVVTANGRGELVAVRIDPEVAKPEELDMLQDLVVAAANDALGKARELMTAAMNKLAGGLALPGLF